MVPQASQYYLSKAILGGTGQLANNNVIETTVAKNSQQQLSAITPHCLAQTGNILYAIRLAPR